MKKVIDKSDSRGHSLYDWLDSHHTFSFDEYYNPRRMNFGALRVLNDDRVAPGKGFGTHPHKNMEIISIPLKGKLKHGDNHQNSRVITPGDIYQIVGLSGAAQCQEYLQQADYTGSGIVAAQPVELSITFQRWFERIFPPPVDGFYGVDMGIQQQGRFL